MMSADALFDFLSVPSERAAPDMMSDPLNCITTMDLEAFAFRTGKDPRAAALYNTDLLQGLKVPAPTDVTPEYTHEYETPEVPSWTPDMAAASPPTAFDSPGSVSSDEGAASPYIDAASPQPASAATSPATARRQRTIPTEPAANCGGDGFLVDLEAEDDMLMSPEEEARLRTLLRKKQHDLETCTSKMKGLTPQNKKRLRNRHASCVSRLKKKLYICNLQRDLEKAKALIAGLQADSEAQAGTIALLQRENAHLGAHRRL